MPPLLKSIYPYGENAHNFVVQEFAELGLVGGLAFVGLIAIGLRRGWQVARACDDLAAIGLFAGCAAYLVTCLTGHPLLVPEAAVPFWAAFGEKNGPSFGVPFGIVTTDTVPGALFNTAPRNDGGACISLDMGTNPRSPPRGAVAGSSE